MREEEKIRSNTTGGRRQKRGDNLKTGITKRQKDTKH